MFSLESIKYEDAMNSENQSEWKMAVNDELSALKILEHMLKWMNLNMIRKII